MAVSAGGIFVDLGLNSARFNDGIKKAGKELNTFGSRAQKVGGVARAALAGIGDGMKLALAGFTVAGIGAGFKAITSDLAQLNAEAKRAGVGAEAFQELAYAARQSLVSIDALTDGLKELSLRGDEFVTTGGGSAAEAFQRLGYTADELKDKLRNPADLFQEIIDKLAQIDRAAAVRIADELFGGTGGEQFVQMLDRGVGSVAKLRAEAQATGNVISAELINKAAEVDRQFSNIAATVGNNVKAAIVAAANALAPFIDTLNKVENQSTNTLLRRAELLREALKRYENYGFSDSFVADRKAELKQLDDLIAARPPSVTITPTVPTQAVPSKGGKSATTREPRASYADLIAVAQERISQMQVEQQALNLTAGAAEALRLKEELLATAKRENIALSPQDEASLTEKARLYGELVDATTKAANAQAQLNDLGADLAGGFISDLRNGVSAADALSNALDRVIDRILNMGLEALFPNSGSGGFLGAIASAFGGKPGGFASGGYTGAGGKYQPAGIVHRGEYVIPADKVDKLGVGFLDRLAGFSSGGLVAPRLPSISSADMARSAGAAPVVNVSVRTLPGTTADVSQSRGADGSVNIAATVRRLVEEEMVSQFQSRGRGAQALERGYGVRRQTA
ncbi:hypothetical protein EJV44_11240 [Ancylobacter aquaticus]|nr:hypothetical protein EJV44_11240 [Ancylobacter aquaticus]